MVQPEFVRINLGEVPGGLTAACQKLPNAPGIYAFFRRIPIPSADDEQAFCQTILETIGERAAPDHDASIGPLHAVSLYSFSKLPASKTELLEDLSGSNDFRRLLREVFMRLPALQAPLYVGKARKLQKRIGDHFKPLSPLAKRLRSVGIPLEQCVLYYCLLDENMDALSDEALTLVEDVITRVLRPGFVLRIG
jgi:hypothetical protein